MINTPDQGTSALLATVRGRFATRAVLGVRSFACLATSLCALSATPAGAQGTIPFDYLDNVEGDYVTLNPVPVRPMALTADSLHLYAVNTHASRVLHFDNSSGIPTQVFHTPKSPVSIALWTAPVDSDPERLVVACRDSYAIVILRRSDGTTLTYLELRDPTTQRILAEPADLLVDQAANRAFVSCAASDAVAEINLATASVVRVFRLPSKNPLFLCFDPNMDVLVAPLFSGNNSGARRLVSQPLNPQHQGPTVIDFATTAIGPGLPDDDLFRLVRSSGAVQPVTTNMGTVLFACGVNPFTGKVWQLNTEANNKDSTKQGEAAISGDIVKNRLSIADLPAVGMPKNPPLGPPIDLDLLNPLQPYDPTRTVGQPYALAFTSDGYALLTGLLTDNVTLLTPTGGFVDEFDVATGGIPRGVLYSPFWQLVFVYCWGTNTIEARAVSVGWPLAFTLNLGLDPTPLVVRQGREIFYDASHSQKNNASCASCHVEGRTDMAVWNLSNLPTDDKGPMVTQTLDGIEKMVPFHWRGEQLKNLVDFNPAFVNLLGATSQLTTPEFDRFQAFVFALQNPPNPFENEDRLVDDAIQPFFIAGLGMPAGAATNGQALFRTNVSDSCEQCHNMPTGTSNDIVADGAAFGDQNPRRQRFKVAPFHEMYRKEQDADPLTPDVQLVNIVLPGLGGGPNENHLYPVLGAGHSHGGLLPNLNAFMLIFTFLLGLPLPDTSDIQAFVHQWDQGMAPSTYRGVLFEQQSFGAGSAVVNYLVGQANQRHCDVAVYGSVTLAGVPTKMRWFFDRRLNPPNGMFVPEDTTQPNQPLSFFTTQTGLGHASNVFIGLPVGTAERFAVDFDGDDLFNTDETVIWTTNLDNRDSDGDSWWDGHEAKNNGNPTDATIPSNDTTNPQILRAVTQMLTAKVARINVETNEPCTVNVSYSFSGGAMKFKSSREFGKAHSILLNDLLPSTGAGSPWLTYTGSLTAKDLAGRGSPSLMLPSMPAFNQAFGGPLPITTRSFNSVPNELVIGALSWASWTANHATLTLLADASVRVDQKTGGPPAIPVGTRVVIARIFRNNVLQSNWTATAPQSQKLTNFNVTTGPGTSAPYAGLRGPFLVSANTSPGGLANLAFSMTGPPLQVGDVIRVNIELVCTQDTSFPSFTVQNVIDWSMPDTQAPNRGLSRAF